MTGQLDQVAADVAADLIGQFGTTCTVKRGVDNYDSTTGLTEKTDTSYTGQPCSAPYKVDQKFVEAGLVTSIAQQVIMPAKGLSVVPNAETDTLVIYAVEFNIVAVNPIYSGNNAAAYEVVLGAMK